MTGLYYEQFDIGMEFKHSLTRTVTESDNLLFCAMTHNPQPLHLDEEFCKGTEYGRFSNPVFHGDTIRSVTKVREKRESKSRPNAGLVIFEHYGFNQRDEEVAFCVRTAFMMKTPS